jgi:hypothetical protein
MSEPVNVGRAPLEIEDRTSVREIDKVESTS